MLSILIPTYNYNIVELVHIVHEQSLKALIPFEIIVFDDCSTIESIKIANNSIIDLEFCNLLSNNKNIGRTASRSLLAKKAKYDLLLFLDADVLPKYDDFISRFEINSNQNANIIYGGVCYYNEKPKSDQILRWKYGHKKETKSINERLKEPYFIISQNLLIKKTTFINNNTLDLNTYGLDILFSGNLSKNNEQVKHIDNPVYHLGLESNKTFFNKSLEAVKTTYILEKNHQIDNDLRPLQKSFLFLKKWKIDGLFSILIRVIKTPIKLNLLSKNPSMFLFDLYRLNFFIELKKNSYA